jgi:hypothetical protein
LLLQLMWWELLLVVDLRLEHFLWHPMQGWRQKEQLQESHLRLTKQESAVHQDQQQQQQWRLQQQPRRQHPTVWDRHKQQRRVLEARLGSELH